MAALLPIIALCLFYWTISSCRCRAKAGNDRIDALLMLGAAAVVALFDAENAVLFLAVSSLIIMKYFEFYYECRLHVIGRLANEVAEMSGQCGLLLVFAGEIARLLCRENFQFYSEQVGQRDFLAFMMRSDTLATRNARATALSHALRFIHADIVAKWGNPSRSHSVSVLVERINRNAVFYVTTAKSGNLADIHNTARKNLSSLFSIYYRNFHLQEGKAGDWSSAAAFAELRQQFETELVRFPVRMELAS
ncbi:MAG: hypothetical protein DELT_02230 [Desulfovibrio sp.]